MNFYLVESAGNNVVHKYGTLIAATRAARILAADYGWAYITHGDELISGYEAYMQGKIRRCA